MISHYLKAIITTTTNLPFHLFPTRKTMDWWTLTLYTLATLLAIPTLPALLLILINFRRTYRVPSHLPWAGLNDKTVLPRTRASLRELTAKRAPITEGYERYAKHGKPFVLPTMHWPEVALPPASNAWLVAQPDSVLSTPQTQDDLLALPFLGHGPDHAAVHDFSVISRDLTRQMGRLLPALTEEVERSFEGSFGVEAGEWREVELYEAVELAARRGVNRVFVGEELCRDERVLKRLLSAGIAFSLCGAVIRSLVPSFLKSVLAPIAGLPFFYQRWRVKRLLLPTITQRMAAERTACEKASPTTDKPNDALQWIISSAYNPKTQTFALTPSDIAGKTLLLNFFALFTTSITAGTILLDILTYTPPHPPTPHSPADLLHHLRTEAAHILPLLPTDPTAVRRLRKLDSAVRETLRFHPMFARGGRRHHAGRPAPAARDARLRCRGAHAAGRRAAGGRGRVSSFAPLRRRGGGHAEASPRDAALGGLSVVRTRQARVPGEILRGADDQGDAGGVAAAV